MISDSELYCPETSNVSITKLAGLLELRQRLDQAIANTRDFVASALRAGTGTNPILARHAFDVLPGESRQALRTVYVLSASNWIEFGNTAGAASDFEIAFALGTPSADEVEQYLRASIDAERDSDAFAAILEAFGTIPEIRHITDCYRIRQAIRRSQIGQCKEIAGDLADSAATALHGLAEGFSGLDRSATTTLLHDLNRLGVKLDLAATLAKTSMLLRDCDRIVGWWEDLVHGRSNPTRALRILQKLAGGRPIAITTMQGRGWVFSHMVAQIEWFVRGLESQNVGNSFVIVLSPDRFANSALVSMYRREIVLVDQRHPRLQRELYALYEYLKSDGSPIAQPIDRFNSLPHIRDYWARGERKAEVIHGRSPIRFTTQDIDKGRELLERMGIPAGAPFACFGVRDDSYYRAAWAQQKAKYFPWMCAFPDTPSEATTDSLMRQFTNHQAVMGVNLANYGDMLHRCADQGIYMLRMGTDVSQDLPGGLDERIIDYARKYRTEFGDLFLTAHCKFILSGATGIYTLSMALKRPIVVTDYYCPSLGFPSTNPMIPNIILPRLMRYEAENRFLTIGEMLQCDKRYQRAANCAADGVSIVCSTPSDIADAAEEINRRIDGTWQEHPDDDDLQARALDLYKPYHEGFGMSARFSASFLRNHRDLIR